jgi:single-strand DNA-binding protein
MSGVNKVIILGRLGADPETKNISSGSTVTSFSLATSEAWKDKDGNKQERTEWHRVVVWGKLAEICGKYLAKGRQAFVEGRLQTRSWEDQQGVKKYTTEIVANNVQFVGGNANVSDNTGFDRSSNDDSPFSDFAPEPDFGGNEEIPF